MHCPRCRREVSDPPPPFCGGCGAPLGLGDEPSPAPLDAPLPIDRRHGGRGELPTFAGAVPAALVSPRPAGPVVPEPAPELAALERSQWDLGRLVDGGAGPSAEPSAGPAAPAPADDGLPEPDVDALEIHLRRPATWRRVVAGAVDGGPFAAAGVALARAFVREAAAGLPAPPTGLDGFIDLVARERTIVLPVLAAAAVALLVYVTLAHALAGATLGKRLLGLRLVGPDGERPSLGRSAARSGLAILSAALLGVGFLVALFNRSGRALHDVLSRTWVVEAPLP